MTEDLGFGFGELPGELLRRWPKGENGEPVRPVYLAHRSSTDMDDMLLVNMLDAYGIPALRVCPGDGEFGRLILGISGTGTDILVPETLYDDAKALMEAEPDDEIQG